MLGRDGRTPEENMARLMNERHPVYALADLVVETRDVNHEVVVDEILAALSASSKLTAPVAE